MLKSLYSLFFAIVLTLSPWAERVQVLDFTPDSSFSPQSWSFLTSFPQIEGNYEAARFGSLSSNPFANRSPSLRKDEKRASLEEYLLHETFSITPSVKYGEPGFFPEHQATVLHFASLTNKSPPPQNAHLS